MANLISVANEMAKKFILSEDKKYALNLIVYDINYLVYSASKMPLSYQSKSIIFKHIFDVIAGREVLLMKNGERLTPDFSDIVLFFERRSAILKHLKAGIKQQGEFN